MRKAITISILLLLVVVSVYVYWFYFNPYSDGYREGILQKFSRRGNVFKTYEGEVVQLGFGPRSSSALNANYFYFSVADEALADSLEKCLGKVVKLHYRQYRRNVAWRGENYNAKNADKGQYIVDAVTNVRTSTAY